MLQIPQNLVHLVHVPLRVVVLHPQLVTVGLADGAVLIRPGVPHVAVQVMDIVGLLLPDPEELVHRRLEVLSADSDDGKLLFQVIAVNHPKELDGVGGRPVLPLGAHRAVGVPHALGQNIFTVLNEYLIGVTHCTALLSAVSSVAFAACSADLIIHEPAAGNKAIVSRRPAGQTPLYFRRVAIPPRMCRWALFSSSTCLAWRYRVRLKAGSRSDRSLCFVVTN